jgi:hypothetical protein
MSRRGWWQNSVMREAVALSQGVGVPSNAIRQRDSAVIRDRAGNTIQVRS